MTDVKFSARAYAKVLLHAIKYPHCAINGLLLGKYSNGELSIVDAVPLFHISLHLAPMGELALNTWSFTGRKRYLTTRFKIQKCVWPNSNTGRSTRPHHYQYETARI
ncbi:unnamed protein product [Trichogramma brassicae]|uniref:MPN domain-containing protein n=1 Tax=Trichogramma brassicae TaxID=86971 RepID=A0A6H5J5F9_9HYME|nr:unnamed protein product [Trichogramma brassicae]